MAIVTALVEFDPETHQFVGSIPGIPGARSQGLTLEELSDNLREVLLLLRDAGKAEFDDIPRMLGLHQIEIPA